jgi:hypothetical protein
MGPSTPSRPQVPATLTWLPTMPSCTRPLPSYLASCFASPSPDAPRAGVLGPGTHQFLVGMALAGRMGSVSLIRWFLGPVRWTGAVEDLTCFPAGAEAGLLAALERDGGSF